MIHVYAMMALAARFASNQRCGDSELWELRRDWATRSKRLLDDRKEPVSLSAIQACMLHCCISAAEGETEMESLYGAQAIRMIQLRRLQTSLSTNRLQREIEIRVWWNVWMWDCWESAGSCIRQQLTIDPDFPLPMEEHAFEQLDPDSDDSDSITQQDMNASRQRGLWAQMIPFTEVVAPINEIHELTVQNCIPDAELFDKIERIAERLETWKLNLPSTLLVTPTNLASYSSTGLGRTLVALHTGYHHFSQLLYYQFLHRSLSTSAGCSPIVIDTGEFTALTLQERKDVLDQCVKSAAGRVPVVAGIGDLTTSGVVELAKHAAEAGAAATMIVPPFYDAPNLKQLREMFGEIYKESGLPIMYYNIPSASGVSLSPAEIAGLSDVGVKYLKDTSGNAPALTDLLFHHHNDITALNGWDTLTFYGLCAGAKGSVWGTTNVLPELSVQLWNAIAVDGDLKKGRELWSKIFPVCKFLEAHHYGAGIKTGMELQGWKTGGLRKPFALLEDDERAELAQLLKDAGVKLA
ncbi:Uncharacterized protein Y057_3151 [Fusarium fujikuroi]|nr:Uncharacterized protein Y057_3151 [Fusarium fujikuroi]